MTTRALASPSVEPISRTEAKTHLRETGTEQDDLIDALIQAAREYAENLTGRAFVQRAFELTLPGFPEDGVIEIPKPPLRSISYVKYIDEGGTLQTLSSTLYQADTYREPGLVKPVYLESWPATRSDFNAVQVGFVAGYPTTGSPEDYVAAIPAVLKHWMKLKIAQLYEHREAVVTGTIVQEVPRSHVDGLLDSLMVKIF